MNDDWRRIEELFHETIELPAAERAAYLSRVCGEDSHLRSEVEAYLAAYDARPEIMEEPAFSLGLEVLSKSNSRPSLEGKQIGPYRILRQLGEGGMGEVYLAEDTRLSRNVALKFLSQKLVNDAWAKRQLKREAQAVAKLDHPNICAVHGFEELDGHSFIVMQYIEGETLYTLVQKDSLSIERVPHIAYQIAGALAEAHAHGIIHRDIKPKNIMVSASGLVKVLDFGLAKSAQQSALGAGAGESRGSSLGLVVGTVRYMSPEQLKAEKLDFRSDIFSFGIVLYEMITGSNPFAKDSDAESITAILGCDLPVEAEGPKGLLQIARKCLIGNREQRYQSVSEVLLDLEDYLKGKKKIRLRPIPGRLRTRVALATILLVVIAAAIVYSTVTRVRTLAVLPVANKSGDQSIDYLGDGLTDTLIHRLSRLPRLKVKPRTLVSGYKDKQIDPVQAGRALNVELVFSSEITKRGEQPVLETRLIRTKDGSLAWGETRSVNPRELLSLHEELCKGIAEKSLFYLRDSERNLLTHRQTSNPEAFRRYFLGRHYWNNRNKENLPLAIESFEQAIKLDPLYAQAYAGLADCYAIHSTVAYGPLPTREAMPKARAAAQKALEIDNTICEAHTSLGLVKLRYDWEFSGAENEFKLAINFNSDYSPAHFWYSNLLALTQRYTESIVQSEAARDLDPLSPLTEMNFGRAFYYSRQYKRAQSVFEKMLEKDPNNASALNMLGLVYLQLKDYNKVIDLLQIPHSKDRTRFAATLGYAYGKARRAGEAIKILEELEAISKSNVAYVPVQEKAVIQIGLNNRDKAILLLREACAERFPPFPFIKVDPLFDDIRLEPGFAELMRCANLPL